MPVENVTLRLTRFTHEDGECYAAYRRLKYEVFVVEQEWQGLSDARVPGMATEDPFDRDAHLWLVTDAQGEPAGIVRGLPVRRGFPHRELFDSHRTELEAGSTPGVLATINALAVRRAFRRVPVRIEGTPGCATLGRLLVLTLLSGLEADGCDAAVATAGGERSLRLFRDLGFRVLDPPRRTPLHEKLDLTNVGVVFASAACVDARARHGFPAGERRPDPDITRLMRYFDRRQSEVLMTS